MKKLFSVFMTIIMVFSVFAFCVPHVIAAGAREYYIDSVAGDDSGDGTFDDPWKTIDPFVNHTIDVGDKILFKCGGVYEFAATLSTSGTKENPILRFHS